MLHSYFGFIFVILNLRIPIVNLENFTTSTTTTEGMYAEDFMKIMYFIASIVNVKVVIKKNSLYFYSK